MYIYKHLTSVGGKHNCACILFSYIELCVSWY